MANAPKSDTVELNVQLMGGQDIDPDDIDAMARRLRSELEALVGTEHVNLATRGGQIPEGGKGPG